MTRNLGHGRRRMVIAGAGTAALAIAIPWVAFGGFVASADGGPHTFPHVACSAKVGSLTLTQAIDITVDVRAPDNAPAGSIVTIDLPGASAELPNEGPGVAIVGYKNLSNTFSVSGGTIVAGSAG